MKRTIATVATLLVSLSAATAFAQQYPQQYPPQQPQQYPPQQGYPQQYPPQQQQYPQQQYPQQGFQQQGGFQPAPYAGPSAASAGFMFGSQGQFILSADRLFGLYFWSSKVDLDNGASSKESGTAINLLFGDNSSIAGPYATPRLGFDFAVANSITIGGAIGFISRSGSTESSVANGASTTADSPTVTGFAFAPRFGYVLGINQMVAIWFKGGITYFTASSESKVTTAGQTQTDTFSNNGFSLDLEPAVVITPVPRFGFTAGLLGDIALSGNSKFERSGAITGSQERPTKVNNFGLALGLVGAI